MTKPADRVVVTGLGAITPLGDDVATTWKAIAAGECATRPWPDLEADGFPLAVAARIDRSFGDERRRGADLALIAAAQAVGEADGGGESLDRTRTGVFIGSTMGESAAFERVSDPSELDMSVCSVAAFGEALRDRYAFGGPSRSVGAACAAGNYALLVAAGALRHGRVDAAVAGGVEPFSRLAAVGFARMRATADDRCRPFDVDRTGMLRGEAAAVAVLEREADARRRGARPLASIEGWGLSADAHHPTAPRPDGSGMADAMRACLRHSGVEPAAVGWICAHGTGTHRSDAAEARAVREVFGTRPPPVTSLKGALGHSMGAAAAVEAVMVVRAMESDVVPPTANLERIDPDLGLDVPAETRSVRARYVLNAAYGFGGVNSAILLGLP